jgi:Dolichyl-phosphate-mannose-protein mannosyltransferase
VTSTPGTTAQGAWWRALTGPAAVVLVLAVFWAVLVSSLSQKSLTFDEAAYAAAGCSYWRFSDYRLNPEAGQLPQRVAGFPLARGESRFPSARSPDWQGSNAQAVGWQFFYGLGNDARRMASQGRAACGLLAVALGAVIWGWSRRLFGPAGGMISLLLYVLNPGFLANGALMTSDTAAALFFTAATWAWWQLLRRVTSARLVLSGALAGALLASKMSAILLAPVLLILAVARILEPAPLPMLWAERETMAASRARRAWVIGALCVGQVLLATVVLWSFYGFRFAVFPSPAAGDHLQFDWNYVFASPAVVPMRLIDFARRHELLPEGWLYGLGVIVHRSEFSPAFLNGNTSPTGWFGFFPYVFSIKTPLVLVGILGLGLASSAARRATGREALPLWLLIAIYGGAAMASRMNIGHRYLLPVYPPLFILCGASAAWLEAGRRRAAGVALCGLLAAHAAETAAAYPDYLSYVNGLVRRPEAWRHIVDSSLDWGQDLPAVARFIEEHPGDGPFHLGFFGVASPAWHRVNARLMYDFDARYLDGSDDIVFKALPDEDVPQAIQRLQEAMPDHDVVGIDRPGGSLRAVLVRKPGAFALGPGTYFVSATLLQSVCDWEVRGPWTPELERRYRGLESMVAPFLNGDAAARDSFLERAGARSAKLALYDFRKYRMAKLAAYLRNREPEADLHGSILVFRLSAADLAQAFAPAPHPRAGSGGE